MRDSALRKDTINVRGILSKVIIGTSFQVTWQTLEPNEMKPKR